MAKEKQTIKWEVATDTLYVGDYFKPTATATSGLTVSYYVYDFFNWNIGNRFFITNKGEAILIAKQEGDISTIKHLGSIKILFYPTTATQCRCGVKKLYLR